jgi:mannose-6-phosphate isomerase-like protein (cupin superfamily)
LTGEFTRSSQPSFNSFTAAAEHKGDLWLQAYAGTRADPCEGGLAAICKRQGRSLKTKLPDFEEDEVANKVALLVKPGESRGSGPGRNLRGHSYDSAGRQRHGWRYAIIDVSSPPMGGPPLHRHSREDESFYILEGEFDFETDGKLYHAGPGCSMSLPRGRPHRFQNVGSTSGRMLSIVQPAGFERFFLELAVAAAGMKEPDRSVMVPIFEKYGLELLGPPMAVSRAQTKTAG